MVEHSPAQTQALLGSRTESCSNQDLTPFPQLRSVELIIEGPDVASVQTSLTTKVEGESLLISAVVTAVGGVAVRAGVRVATAAGFGVGMYEGGVIQRVDDTSGWAFSPTPLTCFYTMDPKLGSSAVTTEPPAPGICEWVQGEGAAVTLILIGAMRADICGFTAGPAALGSAADAAPMSAGESRAITIRVDLRESAGPAVYPEAVTLPDERDTLTHAIALWGSQVPSLGTLEIPGSAYPTINLPRREYGTLHTFFDPDAWSVVASLSFSGVAALRGQARDIIERSLTHITPAGLVPHHFDAEEPMYTAISGSPQPGPNIFLVEAAIDHACATGDFPWLATAWHRGLRAACIWLLQQVDPTTGLLYVEGALWVDVFRRRGFTLDTNAMVVRTFGRAAEVAQHFGDGLEHALHSAAEAARLGLQLLWSEDHFVTSLDREPGITADHMDAENFLAIAVGATSAEQTRRIVELFDGSLLTHPGGRGTWVSLHRYDGEDCYLFNAGDSDVAMARLWWADLLARRRMGDRVRFAELYEAVRADLLELVWMRERYAAGGHMTRARGYHEYPGILDMMLREGLCGISLDVRSVEVAPMRSGPFVAQFGELRLEYAADKVSLHVPGDAPRRITVRGLVPHQAYMWWGGLVTADAQGAVRIEAEASDGAVSVVLTASAPPTRP